MVEGLGECECASKWSGESGEVMRESGEIISSFIGHRSWWDNSIEEFGEVDPGRFELGEDFPAFNFSFARLKT